MVDTRPQLFGRKVIYTDEKEVNANNIIKVLEESLIVHGQNADAINFLLNYEAGLQPLVREKTIRSDIDITSIDNIAHEVASFQIAYRWGNPITIIQRGEKDSGTADEPEPVALLNEQYEAENIRMKNSALARFVEITGIGYTYVDVKTDWVDGDAYFCLETLDPRNAFAVRSNYFIDKRVVLAVTFSTNNNGEKHFTCFTPKRRYEIVNFAVTNGEPKEPWAFGERSGERNPLGIIPITEYIRNHDRMGCFEREIDAMNALNILQSDYANGVEQNVQAYVHANDLEFPVDEEGNPSTPESGDWIFSRTTADGKTPFIRTVTADYDCQGQLANILAQRSLILERCCVPETSDASGGATGVAMSYATGWSSAEASAQEQEGVVKASKMLEIRIVLAAIKLSPHIDQDSDLLKLRYIDVEPSIKRQRTYDMTTKANAFATLVTHGVYGLHAMKFCNMFEDVNQVWADSKDVIEKMQEQMVEPESSSTEVENRGYNRLMSDPTDQVTNSPHIDGLSTGQKEKVDGISKI